MESECLIAKVALTHHVLQDTIQSFGWHLFRGIRKEIGLLVRTNGDEHTSLYNASFFIKVIRLVKSEKGVDGSAINIFVIGLFPSNNFTFIITFVTWRW